MAFAGGARLIQDQAACPFRAFAAHRLGATRLEEPHEGLDARERGSVLHAAVARLWGALRSSERLAALREEELAREVAQAVDLGLARWRTRRESAFKERFLALERERLQSLLARVAGARAATRAVRSARRRGGAQSSRSAACASSCASTAPIASTAGATLLLDYKTGKAQTGSWFDARPDEPQLPLYALATRGAARRAGVRPPGARGLRLRGAWPSATDIAPGIEPFAAAEGPHREWTGQLEAWRQTLDALGEQFRSGVATVDPKRYPSTCDLCHLRTLCRVEELLDRATDPRRAGGRGQLKCRRAARRPTSSSCPCCSTNRRER